MKQLSKAYKDYSISENTMKTEHILPCFVRFLDVHADVCNIRYAVQELKKEYEELETDSNGDYTPNSLNDATLILFDTVFFLLNDVAPNGCYFGSHIGNGSDYGFWELEV